MDIRELSRIDAIMAPVLAHRSGVLVTLSLIIIVALGAIIVRKWLEYDRGR